MPVNDRQSRFLGGVLDERPRAVDIALAIGVAIMFFLSLLAEPEPGTSPIDGLGVVLALIPAGLVLCRRTRPVAALGIGTVFAMAYWVLNYPGAGALWALIVLLYSTAVYASERRKSAQVLPVFLITILVVLVSGYFAPDENEVTLGIIVTTLVLLQFAWLAGDAVRNRRNQIARLQADMALARAERERATELAVDEERNRIARELHDVVAHAMSVIVVQAEGAKRLVGRDDAQVADALAAIEYTGRTSLNDIRGIVGKLRADGNDFAPTPELANISELLEQCRDAGLDVVLTVDGEPRQLATMTDLSAYRVVQESLTNVRKHAGPNATAEVTIHYGEDDLRVTIADDGRGAAADAASDVGHGLLGMRERVEAFGGTFAVGPRTGGGFSVRATFPAVNRSTAGA